MRQIQPGESEAGLRVVVEAFIWRGGAPSDPLEYKKIYRGRLHARIRDRLEELRCHEVPPDKWRMDPWKRQRLAGVGADFIIPNFLCHDQLLAALFPHA